MLLNKGAINNKRVLSRIIAIILLLIGLFLQINSEKIGNGDGKFLIFLFSEWFLLIPLLIFLHGRLKGGLKSVGIIFETGLINYWLGFLTGLALFIIFILLALFFKGYAWNGVSDVLHWEMILLFAVAFIGQTAFEELIFRGLLLSFIAKRSSRLIGIVISALLFSLLHITGHEITILTLCNIFLMASLFSILVLVRKSLFISCGIHFAWNFLQMVIFNTPNSTNRISESGVFRTSYLSNDINLTGGSYGPEGSFLVTIIFIVIILLVLAYYKDSLNLKEKIEFA